MKLAILYGGPSSEREVSFGTKDFFLDMYKEYQPLIIEWLESDTRCDFVSDIKVGGYAVVMSAHGEFVEDGYLQRIFEKEGIEFTGSDSKSSFLAMDKRGTYKKVQSFVKTIPTYQKPDELSYPFVAKPNDLGSSIGVQIISREGDLNKLEDYDNYIFQPYIGGSEVSLGSVREGNSFMELYPTEIIPKSTFFDYKSKYEVGGSEEITPARLELRQTRELQNLSNKIHDALGLGYYSRADFIVSENEIHYLETNSLPGMTKTSLLPQQLQYAEKMQAFKAGLLENLISKKA